jgi:phenylacetic acid degradation operon negative regulatory protein
MVTTQPKSLILDLYAVFVRRLGGWIAVADLVTLTADVGIDEQATRSAISRMKRAELLDAETRDDAAGYALTEQALEILSAGDHRIFNSDRPADLADGWVIAVFSVPEKERDQRYVLRSRLAWLGFGQVEAGVWIAPRRSLPDVKRVLEANRLAKYVHLFEGSYSAFLALPDLVSRVWDLDQLRELYNEFLTRHQPVLERWRVGDGLTDQDAFVDHMRLVSEWRRLPYQDPGLPPELVPSDWEAERARQVFNELHGLIEMKAFKRVLTVVER